MVDKNSSKLITIILAIVISVAAITIIYVNLPKTEDNETTDNETPEENNQQDVLLQFIYGDEITNYTLDELEALESFTGSGGYINSNDVTSGPYELTGVKISTILAQIDIASEEYNVTVSASDYSKKFNLSYINGEIPTFNETGEPLGIGDVTMILSYKIDGEYLDSEKGPLWLTFDYEGGFTSSRNWVQNVISIEITEG